MANVARDLLRGAADLHIHTWPDVVPRLMDDFELAEAAQKAGMAALLLKSHHMLTADRAALVQKRVPNTRVFGGLALNVPSCGGLNPEAVKVAIKMGAGIIWLPTFSAANHIKGIQTKVTGLLGAMAADFAPIPVPVLDENGQPLPALKEILSLAARADVLIGTGHLTPAEVKACVRAALDAGVKKILVNHPELWIVDMGIEDQIELAAMGAKIEHCIRSITSKGNEHLGPKYIADQIKAVGAEHIVMSTDYGQLDSPPPVQGMMNYIEAMLDQGISAGDIELMVKTNPRALLGI